MAAFVISLFAVFLSVVALAVAIVEADNNSATSNRQLCLQWFQFVLSERRDGVPDWRIDLEGNLLSSSTHPPGVVTNPNVRPPATRASSGGGDTIGDTCGTAEQIRNVRP